MLTFAAILIALSLPIGIWALPFRFVGQCRRAIVRTLDRFWVWAFPQK